MLVTLTNNEVLFLSQALNQLPQSGSIKVKYALLRVAKAIQPTVETLDTLRKPSEEFNTYQTELRAIANDFCEKDGDNVVLYTDETFKVKANDVGAASGVPKPVDEQAADAMKAAFEAHKEKNKDVIDRANTAVAEFNKLLNDIVEIEINKIGLNDLETIGELDYKWINALMPIVDPNR